MKKSLIATLLATAATSSFAFAPAAAVNQDPAAYRNATQKAAADYKAANAKCSPLRGNDQDICSAEAKAMRARAEADAVAQYNSTTKSLSSAWAKVADADYKLAKERCDAMSGDAKNSCESTAKATHATSLADAKAGRMTTTTTVTAGVDDKGLIANTNTREPAKADAVDKCAQVGGNKTGCLIDNRAPVATAAANTSVAASNAAVRTENAAERAVDKTKTVASNVAEKTKEVAHNAVEKTKQVASNVANRTENATERAAVNTRETAVVAADRTDRATDRMGDKTEVAAAKTATAASDTTITTKVKAGIFAEPELKSMAIHVETEKGVVMLSGFVDSKAEAAQAVKVAKNIEGVKSVKSSIKVK